MVTKSIFDRSGHFHPQPLVLHKLDANVGEPKRSTRQSLIGFGSLSLPHLVFLVGFVSRGKIGLAVPRSTWRLFNTNCVYVCVRVFTDNFVDNIF